MHMTKEWREIPEFEGLYYCSIVDGSIKSTDRVVTHNGRGGSIINRIHKGRVLKPSKLSDKRDHRQVSLCKDGIQYHKYIHDVVAITYPEICGEWFDGCIVHHIDHNESNNSPYNLKVLSRSEHMKIHMDEIIYASGLVDRKGKNNPKSKTVLVYTTDFNVVGCYDSASEASKALNCSPGAVMKCCNGSIKTCKGYYCEYI